MIENIRVDREFIESFNQVRKCLKQERGVEVRLTQSDVFERLRDLYGSSSYQCQELMDALFRVAGLNVRNHSVRESRERVDARSSKRSIEKDNISNESEGKTSPNSQAGHQKMYRGRVISSSSNAATQNTKPTDDAENLATDTPVKKRKRVYRGQVIED